ncbi:hypothetical protein FF2_022835 [Malus domestica]
MARQTSKNAQPLLTFEKTLPTRLLAQKSKKHRSPNLERQTPNKITCSKIEEAPPSESREPDSQQDYLLKNRRGTSHRISRARLPTGLFAQKSKRHRSPNLKSQTPNRIALSESREPDPQHDCLFENRRGTALPNMIACSKIEEAPLSEL